MMRINFTGFSLMLSLLFLFLLSFSTIHSISAQDLPENGIVFPEFNLWNLNGESIQKKDIVGKVVVIDFWATWCAPCIKSFPAMIEVENSFTGNENVVFLYVNTLEFSGRDETYISNFLSKKGFDLLVYLDRPTSHAKSLSDTLGITSLPSKLIIDKSGKIRYRDSGFTGTNEEFISGLRDKINSLLAF